MTNHRKVTIGFVQMNCSENPDENRVKAIDKAHEAARQGANIVCFQELFCAQYFCITESHAHFDLAEPVPGPSTETFQDVAKELGIVIIASLFEKLAAGLYYNTAAVIDADGTYLGKYRKMHIPDDPDYFEKFYFAPGDLGFKTFATRFGNIGVLICWDQWFPEAARLTALRGADILFYPTAIGKPSEKSWSSYERHLNAWQMIQRSHAIANGVIVVAVNRVGREGPIEFWGSSFVCNELGEVLFEASRTEEELGLVKIDLNQRHIMLSHYPFLRDRRIDAYDNLTRRYIEGSV